MNSVVSLGEKLGGKIVWLGQRFRAWFDGNEKTTRYALTIWIAASAALAGLGVWLTSRVFSDACKSLPVALIRLEVAFSPARFATLFNAESPCDAQVTASFLPDYVFAIGYGVLLSALYVWAERWRRRDPNGTSRSPAVSASWRHDVIVLLPIGAALLDCVENTSLWWATTHVVVHANATPGFSSSALELPVLLGSIASALKWTLLLCTIIALIAETLNGPRGAIVRALRFNVAALLIGAVPLAAIGQGQDILERVAEGGLLRTLSSMGAIAFAAVAVWYCGRRLLLIDYGDRDHWKKNRIIALAAASSETPNVPTSTGLPASDTKPTAKPEANTASVKDLGVDPWYDFFARNTPRVLGVTFVLVCGFAFARAGLAATLFVCMTAVSVLAGVVFDKTQRVVARDWAKRGALLVVVLGCGAVLGLVNSPLFSSTKFTASDTALWNLRIASAACLGLSWILYVFVYHRRNWQWPSNMMSDRRPYDAIPKDAFTKGRIVYTVGGVVTALTFVVLFASDYVVAIARWFGPLGVLSLTTASVVFFGGIAVGIYSRWRIPIIRILICFALLFGAWNENHRVRYLANAVPKPQSLAGHFKEWIDARQHERLSRTPATSSTTVDDTIPMVLVAASGGGLRAAYWTGISLAALQDLDSSFARHVFAISGVSGGSLGAGVFTALTRDGLTTSSDRAPCAIADSTPTFRRCIQRFMGDDFLSPVLAKLVAPDLLQRFWPYPIARADRSWALEDSWKSSYDTLTKRQTLAEGIVALTRDSVARVSVPALFLNATHVETGRRYIASGLTQFTSTIPDAGDVVGVLGHDLSLAAAIHNSARFTYVSPAGHLDRNDGKELGRLVDGGYFENSGLVTLKDIYDAVLRWNETNHPQIAPLVLYLCNDPVECSPTAIGDSISTDSVTTTHATWANEIAAPIRALLDTRSARGSLAKAQLETQPEYAGHFRELDVCGLLHASLRSAADSARADSGMTKKRRDVEQRQRERVVSPPLGWLLSQQARDWMDSSLGQSRSEPGSCPKRNYDQLSAVIAHIHR